MRYDLLIVGAGLTAATICARLRGKLSILVLDVRPYVGGNCADYWNGKTFVHLHGPHSYHCPADRAHVTEFLSQFTSWTPFEYTATSEIEWGGELAHVPFPYSKQTEAVLGRSLTDQEISKVFFHDYTEKAWGMSWDEVPKEITGRIPRRLERSDYFPGHWQATPTEGFTRMFQRMFAGVDVMLSVDPSYWRLVRAGWVVYCGRPELVLGDVGRLPYRTTHIEFTREDWAHKTVAMNYDHHRVPWTRKVNYSAYGGPRVKDDVVSVEFPCAAGPTDPSPFYPITTPDNRVRWSNVVLEVKKHFPRLFFAGRLGCYEYLDMWDVVDRALTISLEVERC